DAGGGLREAVEEPVDAGLMLANEGVVHGHVMGAVGALDEGESGWLEHYPVTAPSEADRTVRAYLARTPRFSRGAGRVKALRRRSHSSAARSAERSLRSASIVTMSPSLSKASGPPVQASGATWPTTRPW